MELVKTIIRNGLNQNAKELKAGIVELNPYKRLVGKNKGFDFNVKIGYSKSDDLLELCYEVKMIGKRIIIQFLLYDGKELQIKLKDKQKPLQLYGNLENKIFFVNNGKQTLLFKDKDLELILKFYKKISKSVDKI